MKKEKQLPADLIGPLTTSEFISKLENIEKQPVKWIERSKSHRASSSLSYLSEGWIVALYPDWGECVALYDSVQNPPAYLQASHYEGRVVGYHDGNSLYLLN